MYPHDGGLARVYRLERPRRQVTEADVEAHVRQLVDRIEDPESRSRVLENVRGRSRADSFPSISRVLADGEWLGTVETPPGFQPQEIGADYAHGFVLDSSEEYKPQP